MRKIRLFVDGHIFDKEPQGTRTFIKEIYNIISNEDSRFEILLGAYNVNTLKKNFPHIKEENLIKFSSRNSYIRLGIELPYLIKRHRIDFAHFQYVVPPIKFCKYIITTHDILFCDFPEDFSFLYKKINGYLFKLSALKSDIITTVSSYSKVSIMKHFGISSNQIHVLPNGVNENFFKDYQKDEAIKYIEEKYSAKNYILYVSRIEARKNHEFLLDAYLQSNLVKQGVQLIFIGRNSVPVKSFSNKIKNLSPIVKQHVHWFQNIDDEDLIEFYKGARLFVYPSKAEGFGIPPLESVALKIETLCSNSTAMSDFKFLEDNVFDPNQLEELKDKIELALSKKSDEQSLRKKAFYVQENYKWENTAYKLSQIIIDHFAPDENSYSRN